MSSVISGYSQAYSTKTSASKISQAPSNHSYATRNTQSAYSKDRKGKIEKEKMDHIQEIIKTQDEKNEKHRKLMLQNKLLKQQREEKLKLEEQKRRENEEKQLMERKMTKQQAYMKYLKQNSKTILESLKSEHAKKKKEGSHSQKQPTENKSQQNDSKMSKNTNFESKEKRDEKPSGKDYAIEALDLDVSHSMNNFEKVLQRYKQAQKKEEKDTATPNLLEKFSNDNFWDVRASQLLDSLDLSESTMKLKQTKDSKQQKEPSKEQKESKEPREQQIGKKKYEQNQKFDEIVEDISVGEESPEKPIKGEISSRPVREVRKLEKVGSMGGAGKGNWYLDKIEMTKATEENNVQKMPISKEMPKETKNTGAKEFSNHGAVQENLFSKQPQKVRVKDEELEVLNWAADDDFWNGAKSSNDKEKAPKQRVSSAKPPMMTKQKDINVAVISETVSQREPINFGSHPRKKSVETKPALDQKKSTQVPKTSEVNTSKISKWSTDRQDQKSESSQRQPTRSNEGHKKQSNRSVERQESSNQAASQNKPKSAIERTRKKSPTSTCTRDTNLDMEDFLVNDLQDINKQERALQQSIIRLHQEKLGKVVTVEEKHGIKTDYQTSKQLVTKQVNPQFQNVPVDEDALEDSLNRLDSLLAKAQNRVRGLEIAQERQDLVSQAMQQRQQPTHHEDNDDREYESYGTAHKEQRNNAQKQLPQQQEHIINQQQAQFEDYSSQLMEYGYSTLTFKSDSKQQQNHSELQQNNWDTKSYTSKVTLQTTNPTMQQQQQRENPTVSKDQKGKEALKEFTFNTNNLQEGSLLKNDLNAKAKEGNSYLKKKLERDLKLQNPSSKMNESRGGHGDQSERTAARKSDPQDEEVVYQAINEEAEDAEGGVIKVNSKYDIKKLLSE